MNADNFSWSKFRRAMSKPISWDDGRPIAATWPGLDRHPKADSFAKELGSSLAILIDETPETAFGDKEWLNEYCAEVAEEYLLIVDWRGLPTGGEYLNVSSQIERDTRKLLETIQQASLVSIEGLAMAFSGTGIRLRGDTINIDNLAPQSLDHLLRHLIWHCEARRHVRSKPGARPRTDHAYAAAVAVDLWEHLSGQQFPMNFKVHRVRECDRQGGGFAHVFDSAASRFVEAGMKLFDPKVTPAQARTALKTVPWAWVKNTASKAA